MLLSSFQYFNFVRLALLNQNKQTIVSFDINVNESTP